MSRRTGMLVGGGLAALAALALAGVLAIGFDWRDPSWRGLLERELSNLAARPVTLAGPLRLRVSSQPVLVLEDVRIGPASAGAGGGLAAARIGRLELGVGLLPSLLAAWPHVEHFAADAVELQVAADAGRAVPRIVAIDRAEGRAPATGPAELEASGVVEGHPFRLRLEGGALAALADAGEHWPVQLFAEALGASLVIAGSLEAAGATGERALAGHFEFGIGAPDAQASARLVAAELPAIGPSALAGRVHFVPGRIELRELVGSAGASRFEGELDIIPGGVRPRIDGRLGAAVLDMRPFLGQEDAQGGDGEVDPSVGEQVEQPSDQQADQQADRAAEPGTLVDWYRGLDDARLPLAGLRLADGRIALSIEEWIGMPTDVGAASVELELVDGRIDAPLRAHVAGVDLAGELHAEVDDAGALRADLALGTIDTPLGGLARWLFGIEDLRGALGGFSMRLVAHGAEMRELVDTTEVRLVVARGGLTYGNAPGERPVAFELGSFAMTGGAGEPLTIEANGSLLGEPVELGLATDPPHRIVRSGTSSLALRASSRSLRLALDGGVASDAAGAARDAADLRLQLDAGDARDLARWLGTEMGEAMPLALGARLRGTRTRWRIEPLSVSLGGHRVGGSVSREERSDGSGLAVHLEAPRVDIDELGRLFARASAEATPLSLDIPILPAQLDLADLDLDLRIDEVSRSVLSVRDVRFTASIREGYMSASPLSMVALGLPLAGALEVDLRSEVPAVNWWLAGSDVDAGALLRRLGFGERVDAGFGSLGMHLAARGSRLGDLLDASALTAEIEGGRVRLLDPGTGSTAGFELASGSVVAAPGQPVRAAVVGRAGQDSVAIALQAASLRELVDPSRRIPISVQAGLGGAHIQLEGDIERPLGAGLRLAIEVAGDRIDGWSPLTGIDLPDWGPYGLAGDLLIDGSGYRVDGAQVSVGESRAHGSGRLDTTRSPPRLDLKLDAPTLSLDDFDDEDWSPFGADGDDGTDAPGAGPAGGPATGRGAALAEVGEQAARASEELQQLLGADTLARLDVDVAVEVGSLRAGEIRFGDARLHLSVAGGRARFEPVEAAIGDGRLRLVLDYAPLPSGAVEAAIDLELERVPYGLLAQSLDPESDVAGEINVHLDIRALTPTLSQAMRDGDGSLRFLLRPERMSANVFDLWAGNLFIALIGQLDTEGGSTVNCALGEFALTDGVLHAQRMVIDTTRVRVLGAGAADFNDSSLSLRFNPWPKRAGFFSLATPIEVGGSFDDYTIGPRAGDVLMTGLRLLSSVLWVPVMKLAGASSPADGSDVCGEPVLAARAGAAPEASAPKGPAPATPSRRSLAPVPALDSPLFYGGP